MAHLVPVKTHSSAMSGSQSLQDQTGSALSEAVNTGSPRPEIPRQNSDPMSETPGPPMCIAGREERDRDRDRDRDRTAWLREEDIPPKVRVLRSECVDLLSKCFKNKFYIHSFCWIFHKGKANYAILTLHSSALLLSFLAYKIVNHISIQDWIMDIISHLVCCKVAGVIHGTLSPVN